MAVKKDEVTKKWFYYGSYTDLTGKKKQYKKRGLDTKSDAKKAEQLFLINLKKLPINSMSLDEVFVEFMHYHKNRVKGTTVYNDQKKYNNKIKPYFGSRKIETILPRDIIAWQNELLEADYSVEYINNIRNTFSKLYTYAFKVHNVEYNPFPKVDRPKRKNEIKKEMSFWTFQEFNTFISVVDDFELNTLFMLAYYTGARKGELLALTWKDFNNNCIAINKTYSYQGAGHEITPPKTGNSNRIIDLPSIVLESLNRLKKQSEEYIDYSNAWYIFGKHKPIATSTLERKYKKYQAVAEVPTIRFHDLRHSHVSLLINNNIPLPGIASRIGDNIETILSTYSHLFMETNQKIIELLDNL